MPCDVRGLGVFMCQLHPLFCSQGVLPKPWSWLISPHLQTVSVSGIHEIHVE